VTSRGLGWRKDAPDTRDRTIGELLEGVKHRPRSVISPPDMRGHRGPRLEQGDVNACVSFAGSRVIYMSLHAQGHPDPPMPSPLFGYYAARRAEHAGEDPRKIPPPRDIGCYPRLFFSAIRDVGFVTWEEWPFVSSARNTAPPPEVLVQAYSQKDLAYYRIDTTGAARVQAVADALSHNYPVLFGMPVDLNFCEHVGPDTIAAIDHGAIQGGHAMAVLAVDLVGQRLLIDNWWGTDWGIAGEGTAWIDAGLFGEVTEDCYAVVAAPMFAEGAT